MRKWQQKQALEFIPMLETAHDQIGIMIAKGNRDIACTIINDCQNSAIALGEMIERLEGEGFVTVHYLEAYCEALYQLFQLAGEGGDRQGAEKAIKNLHKALIRIENSLKNDVPVRKEVVFLPYKAAMWDSLESVFLAADADPDCDAYVIPVPWYERNQDLSLGTFHYEAELFPDNVPVTHYNQYDFEKRRPDAVFIHNPYDGLNYVTSVHPFFYSENLKKFTDCLVYIPYYANIGNISEAQRSCACYSNVDVIIAQNEAVKKLYAPGIPREKIYAVGSPKFDAVIRRCKNPSIPPEEWQERMQGRTVYFYNTSINGMLSDTEALLKKMEYVFACFREHPEACLLWRPHPLLESTFDSMRKDYKERFQTLKKRFIEEKLGIYDDTPDMIDSIAWSDVYIGDPGSTLSNSFYVTGKPIFLLVNMLSGSPAENDWRGMMLRDIAIGDTSDRWIIARGDRLWKADKEPYRYHYVCDLDAYADGTYYRTVAEIGDKAYIIPASGMAIGIIEDGKIRKIQFEEQITEPDAFYDWCHDDDYIFLLPQAYPYLVRFNIHTEKLDYITGVREFAVRKAQGVRCGGACIHDNRLYIASPVEPELLVIQCDTLEWEQKQIGCEITQGFVSICPDQGELWLLPENGMTVVKYDAGSGECTCYPLPEDYLCSDPVTGQTMHERPLKSAVFTGKSVYFSPYTGEHYLILDRAERSFRIWDKGEPMVSPAGTENGYLYRWVSRGCFVSEDLLYDTVHLRLYHVDIKRDMLEEIPLEFPKDEVEALDDGFRANHPWIPFCCIETALQTLPALLDGKLYGSPHDKDRQIENSLRINPCPDGDCGEKVYRLISKKIFG